MTDLFVNKLIQLFLEKSWYENYLKSIGLFFFQNRVFIGKKQKCPKIVWNVGGQVFFLSLANFRKSLLEIISTLHTICEN